MEATAAAAAGPGFPRDPPSTWTRTLFRRRRWGARSAGSSPWGAGGGGRCGRDGYPARRPGRGGPRSPSRWDRPRSSRRACRRARRPAPGARRSRSSAQNLPVLFGGRGGQKLPGLVHLDVPGPHLLVELFELLTLVEQGHRIALVAEVHAEPVPGQLPRHDYVHHARLVEVGPGAGPGRAERAYQTGDRSLVL